MEYSQGDASAQVEAIRRLKRLKYEKRGRVARFDVAQTKAYLREQARHLIDFVYDPTDPDAERGFPADPSHACITNIPLIDTPIPLIDTPEAEAIGDLIAHCILESWPVQPD